MDQNLSVLVDDTADAYRLLHERWFEQLANYADKLSSLNCDLLLSNISYLSLAAANQLGISGIALSPLNWADIYQYFCSQTPIYARIHEHMLTAYESADVFLKPTPSMPMHELRNTQSVGPIAATGCSLKHWLCEKLGTNISTKLVLVAMGGHDLHIPVTWPTDSSIIWLVTRSWKTDQRNVVVFEDLDIPFLDLLASCDLLVGKPGYGSFVEATTMGKPILYMTRPDWPEEPFLIQWLEQHNICGKLLPNSLQDGTFIQSVDKVLHQSEQSNRPSIPTSSGIEQTVDVILKHVASSS